MKLHHITATVAMMLIAAGTTEATAKHIPVDKIYMFGFAASFNDTIVYMTDVLDVDSAWIDTKTKFLLGREQYTNQLRNHLKEKLGMADRTCMVIYDRKRSKAEKKYLKLKRLYTDSRNKNKFDLRPIGVSDFRFKPVNMSSETVE